jgi:hypothetical protein
MEQFFSFFWFELFVFDLARIVSMMRASRTRRAAGVADDPAARPSIYIG